MMLGNASIISAKYGRIQYGGARTSPLFVSECLKGWLCTACVAKEMYGTVE
jgi:hypothetical protein